MTSVSKRLVAWLISPFAKSAMTCEMSLMTCVVVLLGLWGLVLVSGGV